MMDGPERSVKEVQHKVILNHPLRRFSPYVEHWEYSGRPFMTASRVFPVSPVFDFPTARSSVPPSLPPSAPRVIVDTSLPRSKCHPIINRPTFLTERAMQRGWLALPLGLALLAWIAGAFWYWDWRYARPAPVPVGWVPGPNQLPPGWDANLPGRNLNLPAVCHIMGDGCPCSRFASDEAREMSRLEGAQHFAIFTGVEASDTPSIGGFHGASLAGPSADRLARTLGVYAAPQAVIVSASGQVVYRGNYNRSRYCRDPESAFARRALDALLAGQPVPEFPPEAATPFGCPLSEVPQG